MHKTLMGLLTGSVLLASGVAVAQQPSPPAPPASSAPTPAAKVNIPAAFVKGQAPGQTLARDRLIGAAVHNREGQIIGDIEDLIIASNNQIVGVIMGVGGLFGAGEKKVGVQYGALQFIQKDGVTRITLPSATKEVLAAVPAYQRAEPRKSLIERSKDKARELSERTTESAKDAAVVIKENAGPAYEKAKEAAGTIVDKAKEAVTPAETPAEKK